MPWLFVIVLPLISSLLWISASEALTMLMTWKLVRISPLGWMIVPEPAFRNWVPLKAAIWTTASSVMTCAAGRSCAH